MIRNAELVQFANGNTDFYESVFAYFCDGEKSSKNKDMMQSIEVLRKAIESELNFSNGFSVGVVDASLDHVDIFETDDKNQIKVQVYLKAIGEKQEYLVQRKRGITSVCTRQCT